MPKRLPAFEVDRKGLAAVLGRRGPEWIIWELVQNALDEPRVKRVTVNIEQSNGTVVLAVADDAPDGFRDLSHAYTLFAPSSKVTNPELRGRFNVGEKLVVAACRRAVIVSTTGGWEWDDSGRRRLTRRTDAGSRFEGELRGGRAVADALREAVRRVIPPEGIELYLDGERLVARHGAGEFRATLATEICAAGQPLRRTRRETTVTLYELGACEEACLYELGIPVCAFKAGVPWHVNVGQKVPLTMDRTEVPAAYMRDVYAAVLFATSHRLSQEQAAAEWAAVGLTSKSLPEEAVRDVVRARFGDRAVVRDPSDPEANKLAVEAGYSVVEPGTFSREAWASIRRAEALEPAGRVTPSPKPYHEDGDPIRIIDPCDWTPNQRAVVAVIEQLAEKLLGHTITTRLVKEPQWPFRATYGSGALTAANMLTLNVATLGKGWFELPLRARQLALVIHELAHDLASDHLSREYHEACCLLGGRLAELVASGEATLGEEE